MKTKIIFTVTFIAFTFAANSFAYFNPKKIMETHWTGMGKQVVDEETGNYLLINYEMFDIHFDAVSFTFTGKKRTSIEIEGQVYSSTVEFKASYKVNIQEVFIQMGALINEDVLPYNIQWAHNNMRTHLIPIIEDNLMYQLQGNTIDVNGDPIFEVDFYNTPSSMNDNP